MNIVSAKYVHDRLSEKNCSINLVGSITGITKTICVPLPKPSDEEEDSEILNTNKHYRAIQAWVAAGNTIADPD